jgi:hypothetical protein
MSLTNYSDLKTSVANYLARTDLTDQIPDFIRLAEYRMRREVRIRQMLKSATTATVSGDATVEMPTDFLEARDFVVVGNPTQPLSYVSPSALSRNAISSTTGKPTEYTILASEFQLSPVPSSVYTLQVLYYAAPTLLSDENASNVFMANVPDMLLYASLIEAEPYLMNDARLQTWIAMYERASVSVTKSDESGQYSGVPLSIKAV